MSEARATGWARREPAAAPEQHPIARHRPAPEGGADRREAPSAARRALSRRLPRQLRRSAVAVRRFAAPARSPSSRGPASAPSPAPLARASKSASSIPCSAPARASHDRSLAEAVAPLGPERHAEHSASEAPSVFDEQRRAPPHRPRGSRNSHQAQRIRPLPCRPRRSRRGPAASAASAGPVCALDASRASRSSRRAIPRAVFREAVVPVVEVLVEGAPRDAGQADHLSQP